MENAAPPCVARWLSPDPMAGDIMNPQSLNRYAYVKNNPVNFTDPLRLNLWPWGPLGGGATRSAARGMRL